MKYFAFLIPLIAGCYIYRPINTSTPQPTGQPVRLTLTDLGTANLAAALGPSVEAVSGRLVNDTGDVYVLALSESRRRNGIEIDWRGEQVSISKTLVANIQQRQFSRTRTGVVTASLIAGMLIARQALWGSGGVFGSDRPGPGPIPR